MVCVVAKGRQYSGFTSLYNAGASVADYPQIIGNLRVSLDLDGEIFQS